MSWKISQLEHIVLSMKFKFILLYSRNFVIYLLGIYEEMSGIDPRIVKHEIPTYAHSKPIIRKLRPINLKKVVAIKDEVEKLLKVGFIYPIHLIEWVSNRFPVTKNLGTIHVCIDFWNLNKACPKDNYPTPFIDYIIDEYA